MFLKNVVLHEIYSKKSFCRNTFDQRLYVSFLMADICGVQIGEIKLQEELYNLHHGWHNWGSDRGNHITEIEFEDTKWARIYFKSGYYNWGSDRGNQITVRIYLKSWYDYTVIDHPMVVGFDFLNWLSNRFLTPLKLWVRIAIMARCTLYNMMW
jgi:hypothetical protein